MSDLELRNRQAILQGLEEVNRRINKLQERLNFLNTTIQQVNHELQAIKQEKFEELCKKFGSGPTTE